MSDDRLERIQRVVAEVYQTDRCPDGETLAAAGVTVEEMEAVKAFVHLDAQAQADEPIWKARALVDVVEAFLREHPDWGR